MVKQGNDVWLGNSRGSKYSLGHSELDFKASPDYWKFSFTEMGDHDLKASIRFIKSVTGRSKVTFIGYSQGASQLIYAMSKDPEKHQDDIDFWKQSISGFFALGPIT